MWSGVSREMRAASETYGVTVRWVGGEGETGVGVSPVCVCIHTRARARKGLNNL